MKLTKLILTALAGCAVVSAHAQTVLHMYGSTAYRRASFVSIGALYGSGITNITYDTGSAFAHTTDITAASPAVASTNILFQGTITTGSLSNQNVNLFCNWAGSVGGITSVAQDSHPVYNLFIPTNSPLVYGTFSASSVDVAMADCFQDATPVNGNTPGFSALNENPVAVLEFIWAKGNGCPASITNMGFYTANALLTLGQIPMSQLTGNIADATNTIYLTGRNDDSGTRAVSFVDDQYFLGNATIQYAVTVGPPYTLKYFGPGADGLGDGYSSGGNVSTALRATRTTPVVITDTHGNTFTNNNAYVMSYIGVNDALGSGATASGTEGSNTISTLVAGASTVPFTNWLTYNGVTWSEPSTREGAYSMYGQEHCEYRNDASTTVQNFAKDLIAKQKTQAGASYIPGTMQLGDMNTTRSDDGGPIIHN
jgi:hypothetical protein